MPLEFNAWMLYRSLVDLVLVNDFITYVLFAMAYFVPPEGGMNWTDLLRYGGGAVILLLNVWVKVDAHRVVKDFAWCK